VHHGSHMLTGQLESYLTFFGLPAPATG
jgi:hypothetical protein